MAVAPPLRAARVARRRRGLLERVVFLGPGLTYLAIFLVVPIALILSYTIFQRGRFGGVVHQPTAENFSRAIEPLYLHVLLDSVKVAGMVTVLALLLGYPTAYVIAHLPRRWRTMALILIVVPFWTNFLIRTYAWIVLLNSEGPLNKALNAAGIGPVKILYTQPAVVAGLLYAYLPLMILPLYSSIERLDPELREASANLGAGAVRTFFHVTFPLTLPGVLTGSIFVFVPSIGNFVVPELLGGGKSVMVGNLIRDQFLKARDWPFGSVLALSVIAFMVGLLCLQVLISRRVGRGSEHA